MPARRSARGRRYNHRSMQWVLQHHMPEQYGGGVRSWGRPKTKLDPWGNEVDADVADELHARQRVRIGVTELAKELGMLL